MKLADGRGLQTKQWFPNGIVRNEDIGGVGYTTYKNLVSILALLSTDIDSVDTVIRGLTLDHSADMGCTLRAGAAISYSGSYFTGNTWSFVANPGSIFGVLVPEDHSIVLTNGVGQPNPRIDTIQIRPIQTSVDVLTRNFRDPITGIVVTAIVPTGYDYRYEFEVLEGNPDPSPVAPSATPGWVKLAEVTVAGGAVAISGTDIVTFLMSNTWTTGGGSTRLGSQAFDAVSVQGSDVVNLASIQTITGDKDFTGALQKDGSDVVNLASTQTIAGSKTFSNKITGDISGNADGNAGSATILQNNRTIAGKTFNGSQDVTLDNLTPGTGLSGTAYNGSAAQTWTADPTNIAQGTRTTTAVPITSSTGSNATLGAASTTLAGVMTSADKVKLNGIAPLAEVNVGTNLANGGSGDSRTITSSTGNNVTVSTASTTNAGYMSIGDKSKLNGIAAGAEVNVGTNIAQGTRTTTAVPITSSTGSNASLDAASATLAGVMTSADKVKLNGIAAGADVNVGTNIAQGTRTTTAVPITSSTGSNATLGAASTTLAGVMTSADKVKLNGIATGANANLAHDLGTAVVSTNSRQITITNGTNVTVPIATPTVAGFMSHTDKDKLDGIAAGASNVPTNLSWTNGATAGPQVNSSSGDNAVMPTASASISGAMTTGTQTFAGIKTFSTQIRIPTATPGTLGDGAIWVAP